MCIKTISEKSEKFVKKAKIDHEIRVIDRAIKKLAHLSYDYRYSMLPGAREHYEECMKNIAVLRMKKEVLLLAKSFID